MESLYHKTKNSISQVQEKLKNLEISTTKEEIKTISIQFQTQIDEIQANFDKLDIYVNKEPASRRIEAKIKVDELKYDLKHIQTAFRNIQYKKEQKILEEQRREELLKNSYSYNKNNQNHADTSILLDREQNELRHHSRLMDMNSRMDDLIDHGEATLHSMREQNQTLKSIKTKILSIGNTLGISSTVMKLIQRRSAGDRRIMFGLMILTCIIMFLTIKYLL